MRLTAVVDDYLVVWVLAAVAVGLLVPEVAAVTEFSTPILAVMVGSTSLTLTLGEFRTVDRRALLVALLGHAAMPAVAFGTATLLGLGPAFTAGFVLLGAVTPELVTPTMTELADGDTALASVALVAIGVGSTVFVPVVVALFLGGSVAVDPFAIVHQLLVAVVLPMTAAVAARARWGAPIAAREHLYSSLSAVMVVLIIGGVTAANAALVRTHVALLLPIGAGVLAVNAAGYLLGWVGTRSRPRGARIAVALSVGMRDFAVAAALVVAAGFPAAASLPAVAFGVVEMVTSAGVARWFRRAGG